MPPSDPLDQPSDIYDEWVDKKTGERQLRVLTFRELHDICAMQMERWDEIGSDLRVLNQKHNDPDYKPIAPGAGHRRYRRWRG